jgi:hypothetical protein
MAILDAFRERYGIDPPDPSIPRRLREAETQLAELERRIAAAEDDAQARRIEQAQRQVDEAHRRWAAEDAALLDRNAEARTEPSSERSREETDAQP